jgi:hypothetical protein
VTIGVAALATAFTAGHAVGRAVGPANEPATTSTTTTAVTVARVVGEQVDAGPFAARILHEAATLDCQPPARALAWAEITADGTVLGVTARCATTEGAP